MTNIEWNENLTSKKSMTPEQILSESLTVYEKDIIELADDMASSMTDLNAHNYKNFVDARDKFREKIKEICNHAMKSEERIARVKKVVSEI